MQPFNKYYTNKQLQQEGLKDFAKAAALAAGFGLSTALGSPTQNYDMQKQTAAMTQKDETKVTPEDIVATTLVLEARGEGIKGMQAVNEVINNRAKHDHKQPWQIATAPKQFSCFNGKNVNACVIDARRRFADSYKVAMQIVKAGPTNHTNGARWYHTTSIRRPKWADNLLDKGAKTVTIGHHVFYYLP